VTESATSGPAITGDGGHRVFIDESLRRHARGRCTCGWRGRIRHRDHTDKIAADMIGHLQRASDADA
jgi:hypothetical protein